MPNIKTITLHTGKKLLAVEGLPEGFLKRELIQDPEGRYRIKTSDRIGDKHYSDPLPSGTEYTLIDFLNDCGEEVAKGLVEISAHGSPKLYINYERNHYPLSTALQSLRSLLTSEGVEGNCLLILEK